MICVFACNQNCENKAGLIPKKNDSEKCPFHVTFSQSVILSHTFVLLECDTVVRLVPFAQISVQCSKNRNLSDE